MKVLIVEDEPGLQIGLTDLFEEAGYQIKICGEGKTVPGALNDFAPDMVILDLGLPDMDGTLLLEQINADQADLPVLVLTSRANESDIVLGFKLGAFDYVTKPFSTRVLLARVEALLKRNAPAKLELQLGTTTIHLDRYEAFRDGKRLHLTTREFEILKLLRRHDGKPVSRNDILDEVWGMDSDAGPRTVDTHIALMRKKIEPNPDKPAFLLSQRGIGYKLIQG